MLTCQICGYTHETIISAAHIKSHGVNIKEYHKMFPGHKIRNLSEQTKNRIGGKLKGRPNEKNKGPRSEETCRKISESRKGAIPWNKGIERTEVEKQKISQALKGKTAWNKGVPFTDEQKRRLSISKQGIPNLKLRGIQLTDTTKEKISVKLKQFYKEHGYSEALRKKISDGLQKYYSNGGIAPMEGKNHSIETKTKLSEISKQKAEIQKSETQQKLVAKAKNNNLLILEIKDHTYVTMKCVKCENIFEFTKQIFNPSKKDGKEVCPTCYPRDVSKSRAELELFELIKGFYPDAISGDRIVLGGKEIDIYIPSLKIGFEYTGLYWHRDNFVHDKKHLLNKRDYAHSKGVKLYTIFEDEYIHNREIVISRIKNILGKNDCSIYARKCEIVIVEPKTKNEFLETNHIQGKDSATISLGLVYHSELVALATFKKTNMAKGGKGDEWELSRFCSKLGMNVVGGASRLIKHFMKEHNSERLPLISYADLRWSNGDLYKSIGFDFVGRTPPSFWFFKPNELKRKHRAALMKHRLVKSESDLALTGWELAERNGYFRVFDCGNTKWVLRP